MLPLLLLIQYNKPILYFLDLILHVAGVDYVLRLKSFALSLTYWERPLKSSISCLVSSYIFWRLEVSYLWVFDLFNKFIWEIFIALRPDMQVFAEFQCLLRKKIKWKLSFFLKLLMWTLYWPVPAPHLVNTFSFPTFCS